MTEETIKFIAFHIAKGISYLHSLGIIHRDLKLENIMMSDNSHEAIPKLGDFGASRIIAPNELLKDLQGTVGYCAPEVI
jgi:serine/threonine/tyrosine protein kinase RAD53